VVAFTWLVLEAVHRQNLVILSLAGVVLALATLTRSIMLLFAPFLVLFLLWSWKGTSARRVCAALLPLAVFAAIIAPWAVRNTRVQRTLTIVDVMGGRNAMMGNYEYTPMERSWATISDVTGDRAWHQVLARANDDHVRKSQGEIDKLALRYAIRFVSSHPWLTVKRDVVKFFNFWQLERTFLAAAAIGHFGDSSKAALALLTLVTCGSYAVVIFAALFGLCCTRPIDLRDHLFLIASILFPCVIHTLIFAHERYRLPVMPFLILYAAAAVVQWNDIWDRRRTVGFAVAAALCLMLATSWLREAVMADFNSLEKLLG
jgi:4-amino-4-deoxy-L-arabinose transferase-like glycosyltransferase